MSAKKIRIIRSNLNPSELKGNSRVEKCYAKELGNCSGDISREHYISDSLLKRFGSIPSAGVPWLAHLDSDLSPDHFIARCLCEGHNNHLSPLDDLASKAFDEIVVFGNGGDKSKIVIDGRGLERWLLKCLYGLLATKKFEHGGKKFDATALDRKWLDVLFGYAEFPRGLGIYGRFQVGDSIKFEKHFRIAPAWLDNTACGLAVLLGGLNLVLTLVPKDVAFVKTHPAYDQFMYRLKVLKFGDASRSIRFAFSNYELEHL